MTRYLTAKELMLINGLVIERYTPTERKGIKDFPLFDSALNNPRQSAFGEDAYPTIWEKAAILFATIGQNHGFFSANKRTGFASMKQFLWVNGYTLTVGESDAENYTMHVVLNKPPVVEIATWIEKNSVRR